MNKKIAYCVCFDPYGPNRMVRIVYIDGTTKDLRPGDKGYKSARAAAMRRK